MKILKIVAFLWALAPFTGKVHAIALDEVVLKEMSTSEQSIIIDRGLLEHYQEGTSAKFFVQRGPLDSPKIFLVAEGKLIKSFPRESYWFLNKIHIPKLIKHNEHLLILTSNDVKVGRSMKVKQRHVVLPADQYTSATDYSNKNNNNVPDRLLKDSMAYEESDELYETKKIPDGDLKIESYEEMRKAADTSFNDDYESETEERYFVGKREVILGNIEDDVDRKLLDSISRGYEEKTNAQKYGLTNGLYKDQKKVPGSRELNNQITVSSVYDQVREDKVLRESIAPEAIGKMKRDGLAWSEDMDDTTLRRYFIRTGLEHEKRRRDLALNELDGNEVLFHYAGSLSDHTSAEDQNYRNLGYNLGLGYDLHLSRTSRDLVEWSLQFLVEIGVSDYNVGGQNARGQEGHYGAYLNYYFVNNPLTLNSFIWLTGIGVKAGSIKMQSGDLTKEYNYQSLTLPALQLMTKYRFRSGDLTEDTANVGLSFNAGVMYDAKRLSVIDSLDDNIDGKISINDIKYIVGMSVFF